MIYVVYSEKFLLHQTGSRHPERAERLLAVVQALKSKADLIPVQWIEPKLRNLQSYLEKIHSPEYVQKVRDIVNTGGGNFYGDTLSTGQKLANNEGKRVS